MADFFRAGEGVGLALAGVTRARRVFFFAGVAAALVAVALAAAEFFFIALLVGVLAVLSAAAPNAVPSTPPRMAPTGPPTMAPTTAPEVPIAVFLPTWNGSTLDLVRAEGDLRELGVVMELGSFERRFTESRRTRRFRVTLWAPCALPTGAQVPCSSPRVRVSLADVARVREILKRALAVA